MVLAADRALDGVADAVVHAYARLGCTVVETRLAEASGIAEVPGTVVVAADVGAAECVLEDGVDPVEMAPAIERLAATGWEVTVLSPAHRMGEAHRALRGRPALLQAWWRDGDRLCFGSPEVP
jgi:hypothetical protein